jgi:hypothetical protein
LTKCRHSERISASVYRQAHLARRDGIAGHGSLGRPVDELARENGGASDAFADRFAKVRSEQGPLVWGLDPSKAVLEAWGLGDDPFVSRASQPEAAC